MIIKRLWLTDFRNHLATDVALNEKVTLVIGLNGHGKTNLIEGLHLLSGARSFRGAKVDALVAAGRPSAYLRAEVEHGDRTSLVEVELAAHGRSKAQVNKQKLKRFRDLGDTVRIVVFSPDDLGIIKGSPSIRRSLLDETIAIGSAEFRAARTDFDQIVRQRNNLLKQARGRSSEDLASNLLVWDEQLIGAANVVGQHRSNFIASIQPVVCDFYQRVAGLDTEVSLQLETDWWNEGLADALSRVRADEIKRGMTLVGPHRDDLTILLGSLHSRFHASQGEQRSLALAFRLATYVFVEEVTGDQSVVLLDDVFSELDESRAKRLVECLPDSQIILTSATGTVPDGIDPVQTLEITEGRIHGS
ncbi:MAG: DNA replication/repair protein RecF [Candidatus Poriferisodalaceae bacterium]